jgi:spore coat polysaccharide biosynthesis predicted glycosyltransferase SpsG
MVHIQEWAEYKPDKVEVDKWRRKIEDAYKVEDFNGEKIVVVDDKINYLTGPFANKKVVVNRIFNDLSYDLSHERLHVPSLRKAIKDWVDARSI